MLPEILYDLNFLFKLLRFLPHRQNYQFRYRWLRLQQNLIDLLIFRLLCPNNMTCRMKWNFYTIDIDDFAIFHTLTFDIFANSFVQNRFCKMMTKVFFHSPTGVIGVTVRNNRQINRSPRIDVKFSLRTINAFVCECDEFHE